MNTPALRARQQDVMPNKPKLPHLLSSAPSKPKVSILLITYNHEKYIAQAIESILMQETEYSYEINVIEDCSTDKTQEVVMRYVDTHPHIVKPYFNEKNIGHKVTQKNFYRGFKTMSGDYLAILEGDDYWTSPHKLQKQVSFLETHPDFAICAHNTVKVYEDGSQAPHRFLYWGQQPDQDIQDAARLRSFFHTAGLIYRNGFKGIPPKQFESKWSCDIFVYIAHAQFGKIHHIDEDMAHYRAHTGGRFSTMSMIDGWMYNIDGIRRYNAWLGYRYLVGFSELITRYCASVLSQAGRGDVPRLSASQYVKVNLVMLLYGSIAYIGGLPGRIARLGSTNHFSFVKTIAVIANDATLSLYKLARALTPDTTKSLIRRFEASHAGVRYLRILIGEGRLFTRTGIRQVIAVAHQTATKTAIAMGVSLWLSALARAIQLKPITTAIRRFGASHADVGHVWFLIREGRLFTRKGMFHLTAFLSQITTEVVLGVLKWPYRLVSAITSAPAKSAIRRFEASHAGVRYLRILISEGRLFSRAGIRHVIAVIRQVVAKAVACMRGRAS